MRRERVEQLRQEYAGQRVGIEDEPSELARLAGVHGRVVTINMAGLALVQFDGADRSWHDIELDFVKVIDQPEPEQAKAKTQKPQEKQEAAKAPVPRLAKLPDESLSSLQLSRLELARMEKEEKKEAEAKQASAGE